MNPPTLVTLADIMVDASIQVRSSLDVQTVERYRDALDSLPPISLMRTPAGTLLLVDGFHRVEAAVRAGRTKIRATVEAGDVDQARGDAALANLRHGLPLRGPERAEAIRRIRAARPLLSLRALAALAGCSHETVRRAVTDVTRSDRAALEALAASATALREAFDESDRYGHLWRGVLDCLLSLLALTVNQSMPAEWLRRQCASLLADAESVAALERLDGDVLAAGSASEFSALITRALDLQNSAAERSLRAQRDAGLHLVDA